MKQVPPSQRPVSAPTPARPRAVPFTLVRDANRAVVGVEDPVSGESLPVVQVGDGQYAFFREDGSQVNFRVDESRGQAPRVTRWEERAPVIVDIGPNGVVVKVHASSEDAFADVVIVQIETAAAALVKSADSPSGKSASAINTAQPVGQLLTGAGLTATGDATLAVWAVPDDAAASLPFIWGAPLCTPLASCEASAVPQGNAAEKSPTTVAQTGTLGAAWYAGAAHDAGDVESSLPGTPLAAAALSGQTFVAPAGLASAHEHPVPITPFPAIWFDPDARRGMVSTDSGFIIPHRHVHVPSDTTWPLPDGSTHDLAHLAFHDGTATPHWKRPTDADRAVTAAWTDDEPTGVWVLPSSDHAPTSSRRGISLGESVSADPGPHTLGTQPGDVLPPLAPYATTPPASASIAREHGSSWTSVRAAVETDSRRQGGQGGGQGSGSGQQQPTPYELPVEDEGRA